MTEDWNRLPMEEVSAQSDTPLTDELRRRDAEAVDPDQALELIPEILDSHEKLERRLRTLERDG